MFSFFFSQNCSSMKELNFRPLLLIFDLEFALCLSWNSTLDFSTDLSHSLTRLMLVSK